MASPAPTSPARTIWLTGLPGAGKRTLAQALERALAGRGLPVARLDSGALRRARLPELGFSPADRRVHTLHLAHTAAQLNAHGVWVLVHAVSPAASDRARVHAQLPDLLEVFVDTPKDLCVARGEDGRWALALAGDLRGFTGVDAPYEPPAHPALRLTGEGDPTALASQVLDRLETPA